MKKLRSDEPTQIINTRFSVILKGNKALTVKVDPSSESRSDSGTGLDLSPSGGEPYRLDIGNTLSKEV